eukprot:764271-Hanusia_phi.AAC.2
MQVNGRRLDGLALETVRSLILGQPGTPCELMLRRVQGGRNTVFVTSIIRGGGSREVSPNPNGQTPREQIKMGYDGHVVNSAPNLNGLGEHQCQFSANMKNSPMNTYYQNLNRGASVSPNPIHSLPPGDLISRARVLKRVFGPAPTQKAGLGMTLRNDMRGDLRITDIAPNGPADNAKKFKRMDIITTINGRNVRGMSVVQARDLIMGPVGSNVIIGILREFPGRPRQGTAPGQFLEISLARSLQNVPASRENVPNQLQAFKNPMQSAPEIMHNMQSFPSSTSSTNLVQSAEFSPEVQNRMKMANASINSHQFKPQINEAMCGIGVFIERTSNGLLTIKQISPDGPASRTAELQPGDFLVAIDGRTTLGMPMQQVRSLIVGRRGTSVSLSLRRLLRDRKAGDSLSPIYQVILQRAPPVGVASPPTDLAVTPKPQSSSFNGMLTPDSGAPNGLVSIPSTARSYPPGPHPFTPTFNYLEQPIAQVPEGMSNECGVGLKLIEFDGAIIIQRVFPEGPAGRSGLVMKGDLLHRVDYQTLSELTVEQIRPLLKGPYMSSVVLGLIKPKYRLRVNVRLQREYIADEFEVSVLDGKLASDTGCKAKDIPALPSSQDLGKAREKDQRYQASKERTDATPTDTSAPYSLSSPVPDMGANFIPRGTGPDVVL